MLKLYPSNKTENLAYLMAQMIERKPLTSVFSEELVLIQSQGMSTWLQQEISGHLGVSAMLKCQMPGAFIWKLAERLLPDEIPTPRFEKQVLRWEIFKRLPSKLALPDYQALKDYLGEQRSQSANEASLSDQSLFDISSVLADVFDAYQNYRPDWIAAWENNELCEDLSSPVLKGLERWQADLWRSLYPDLALASREHRSKLVQRLLQVLENPSEQQRRSLPERLFVFGLSALPPQWMPVISMLGRYLDIHFLVHNPCMYYWGDVLTPLQALRFKSALVEKGVAPETAAESFLESNPLLASWGKQGRDYLSLLTELDKLQELPESFYDEPEALPSTCLASIQQDILTLDTAYLSPKQTDQSLQFASCHSALREVEVLHDYLLDLFNQDPSLGPKDIIVMMPDVDSFAPLIHAVFSKPVKDSQGSFQTLPYGLSDQPFSSDQPLTEAILALLNLNASRVSSIDVLSWLEIPAIRTRFGILEEDLVSVKQWVEALNIRWGISAEHQSALLGASSLNARNTWLSATKRVLAGYLYGDQSIIDAGAEHVLAFPLRDSASQELAGKLCRFIDVISASFSLFTKRLSISQWLNELNGLWGQWFTAELLSEELRQKFAQFDADLRTEIGLSGFDQTLEFSVISKALKGVLEQENVGQRFLAGRINFCTLMPMRSIPFKVVCMLGMNEGAYPRSVPPQSFDLLSQAPYRKGDRSRRDDDRYLFLEAVCSARDYLYISYCGRDIQDNSPRYPSVLVAELMAYCQEFKGGARLIEHALQPFHQGYFRVNAPNKKLPNSFAHDWLNLITPPSRPTTQPKVSDLLAREEQLDMFELSVDELSTALTEKDGGQHLQRASASPISLENLGACLAHPLRYYYEQVLQLRFFGLHEALPETEPFAVQGLDAYALKVALAEKWFRHQDSSQALAETFDEWRLQGQLPSAPLDRIYTEHQATSLAPIHHYISANFTENSEFVSRQLTLHGVLLDLEFTLHSGRLVEVAFSKNIAIAFFNLWIKHVFWHLACYEARQPERLLESCLVDLSASYQFPVLTEQQARDFAEQCLRCFVQAEAQPYVFLPKTAFRWLMDGEKKAFSEFAGSQYFSGESSDPYWQRFCFNTSLVNIDAPFQWDNLPDMTQTLLFKQLESIKDAITINNHAVPSASEEEGAAQ